MEEEFILGSFGEIEYFTAKEFIFFDTSIPHSLTWYEKLSLYYEIKDGLINKESYPYFFCHIIADVYETNYYYMNYKYIKKYLPELWENRKLGTHFYDDSAWYEDNDYNSRLLIINTTIDQMENILTKEL